MIIRVLFEQAKRPPQLIVQIRRDCARLSGTLRDVGRSAVPVVAQSDGQPNRIFIHRRAGIDGSSAGATSS
jgi:hypothetical protein